MITIDEVFEEFESARRKYGMSIAELCRRADISTGTYHNIRKDGNDARVSTLNAIAKVLNELKV